MGAAWGRKDNFGTDNSQQAKDTFLHLERSNKRSERRARRDTKGGEQPFLQLGITNTLHRLDSPFLKVATRLAARSCGERYGNAHWCDNGESFIRGDTPIAVKMSTLCAQVS